NDCKQPRTTRIKSGWRMYDGAVEVRLRLRPCILRGGGGGGWHGAGAEIVQHEKTDRRGQIALLAVAVDLADQFGQRHTPQARDFLHAIPEGFFETDA